MRILYNSKDIAFKTPFGTLTEGQACRISLHIPKSCLTEKAELVFLRENKREYRIFDMELSGGNEDYDIYSVTFSLSDPDLYFYYFRITTKNECFSLYKEGYDQTNMEAGELWQLSCLPEDFKVPEDFCGAVMYQIFPDRFNQVGECDTTYKLKPFWVHENKKDIPCYLPNADGEVQNCDFYGGNLKGITEKLDYLCELGVSVIYLNPIFKAWSNHRYDTADYHKIDELLGDEKDFSELCDAAHERGIRIILDGVFSHTGSNSKYFDKNGVFGGGAYHCEESPYRSWYDFEKYPNVYKSWWGIDTLPCVKELDSGFLDYIVNSDDSVIAHWLRLGADGFRLDVADELPDEFIAALRARLKEIKPEALLIGEVWEDASNKVSYGQRRRYFTGGELDSVMNYPFRNCIIDYLIKNDNGSFFKETVMSIVENYPSGVVNTLMNILSTHDTERILSRLSPELIPSEKKACAGYQMPSAAREIALTRLRTAAFLQFVLPGMPCIYYGDELGTEGLGDPFCRGYFDWDRVERNSLRELFARLAGLRNSGEVLRLGDTSVECDQRGRVIIERRYAKKTYRAYVNTSERFRIDISGEVLFSERADISENSAYIESYGFLLESFEK